ncbi:hypothetical protein SLE2022_278420 [Rubroshorea leprosula]
MEKPSEKTNLVSFPLFALLHVLLIQLLLWVSSIQCFFSRFWSFLQSQLEFGGSRVWDEKKNQSLEFSRRQVSSGRKKDEVNINREDVEMVMGRLGLFCSPESKELQKTFGSEEFSGLFEEKEPSSEEVKQAFDVFDVNRDGFIDEKELQRVLYILDFKEGSELDNCKKMIKIADENEDGRIDFQEFVKLMENSFC